MAGIAFLIACFWVWKLMRGDYDEEGILTMSLVLAGSAWVGSWMWRWVGLAGIVVGVTLALVAWCRIKKWDVWEWSDIVARASLVVGVGAALGRGWWAASGILALGAAALWGLSRIYRKFRWYKSGKMGLVGLVGLAWWMGMWMGLAGGPAYKVYLAAWVLIAIAIALYLRSGYKFSDLWPKKR